MKIRLPAAAGLMPAFLDYCFFSQLGYAQLNKTLLTPGIKDNTRYFQSFTAVAGTVWINLPANLHPSGAGRRPAYLAAHQKAFQPAGLRPANNGGQY